MKIISDLKELFMMINLIDIVFFISVILLFILIIVLIYFIKINEDVYVDEIKKLTEKENLEEINKDLNDVKTFTSYEEEQEKRAIISYDELKEIHKYSNLNYVEEKQLDGLSIKKINSEDMFNNSDEESIYQKEEEYLSKLKGFENKLK